MKIRAFAIGMVVALFFAGPVIRGLRAAEPPAEAVPRPTVPRFIFTRPVCQVDGKTVDAARTWLVYDSVTRAEYLVIDGAGITPLLAR